jgi:hypothetical protein
MPDNRDGSVRFGGDNRTAFAVREPKPLLRRSSLASLALREEKRAQMLADARRAQRFGIDAAPA